MSKPSHILKVKHKDSKYGTRVGAAWPTKSGSGLNIRLDPGVAIVGGEGIFITLWPNEERQRGGGDGGGGQYGGAPQGGSYGGGGSQGGGDFGDDDIPFLPLDERVH